MGYHIVCRCNSTILESIRYCNRSESGRLCKGDSACILIGSVTWCSAIRCIIDCGTCGSGSDAYLDIVCEGTTCWIENRCFGDRLFCWWLISGRSKKHHKSTCQNGIGFGRCETTSKGSQVFTINRATKSICNGDGSYSFGQVGVPCKGDRAVSCCRHVFKAECLLCEGVFEVFLEIGNVIDFNACIKCSVGWRGWCYGIQALNEIKLTIWMHTDGEVDVVHTITHGKRNSKCQSFRLIAFDGVGCFRYVTILESFCDCDRFECCGFGKGDRSRVLCRARVGGGSIGGVVDHRISGS